MTESQAQYQRLVARIGKGLGLGGRATEAMVIDHCVTKVDKFLQEAEAKPADLSEVLKLCATRLNLGIREIHTGKDLDALFKEFPPTTEPAIARIPTELVDDTDAVVLQRFNIKPWDQPFLAVINCAGMHYHRRYFSKWHEVVHLLLEGPQINFAFRRTDRAQSQQPLEVLVDRVAGRLAFHKALFKTALDSEIAVKGRLSFDMIDRVRLGVAPEASWQSTVFACVREAAVPVAYARLGLGLRKAEADRANTPDLFPEMVMPATPKLRIMNYSSNTLAEDKGLRMFKNMSVSDASIASQVFQGGSPISGMERLSAWRENRFDFPVQVEAVKQGQFVHCLLHPAR